MDSKLIIARDIKLDKNYTNVLSYDTNDMLSLVENHAEYTENNYNYIDYTTILWFLLQFILFKA